MASLKGVCGWLCVFMHVFWVHVSITVCACMPDSFYMHTCIWVNVVMHLTKKKIACCSPDNRFLYYDDMHLPFFPKSNN